ncbi:efflux transporter outer membrane subunit [Xanthomonas sp. CFBP 8445]|uniref:efflux transporter outer membrane subunit n=1 Tax=Xanthomonas sp. CFBP 8445 TaxID=2971236 RepID=UPI0021DF5F91|nr:efflux transporter outer membrane subunit [Xanthomonas sp. CFBP 8445]UYC11979.1 efflux transporter outer membrane subunit [Xanthomonas sp. CFBP 8445]
MTPVSLTRSALALACAGLLAGCASLAPSYARPDAPVPATFANGEGSSRGSGDAIANVASLDWRQVFLDPRLQHVIAQALEHNRDLRVAVLNIDKARAQYRIQRADLFPSVSVSGSQSASRSSAATSLSGRSEVARTYAADVGISSWELDLFGRIRSLKDEALETYLATAQTQRSTRLSLVAEVAADWLTVAADQQRLALAQQTLDSQRRTMALTEARHREGIASGLDLAQVQTSVESARADVASYTTQLATARNALDLVVGAPVPADALPQAGALEGGIALAPLPAPLESRVLLQRPDVLYAEHTLKSANADIGAARAAFFPTISLTASTGRSSSALSSLFDAGNRTWSFVPSISVPIFRAGALKAQLDVARITRDVNIASYEKAIQSAFSEVADALATRAQLDERMDAQRALVAVTQRSYDLAEARYRNGVDSYLDALDSQRSLYAAQQDMITLRLTEAGNRVTLYKVLGGGADAQSGESVADAAR